MFYYLCLRPRYSGQVGAMPLKQARIKNVTFQLDDSAPRGLFRTHGAVQEVMPMDCIWISKFYVQLEQIHHSSSNNNCEIMFISMCNSNLLWVCIETILSDRRSSYVWVVLHMSGQTSRCICWKLDASKEKAEWDTKPVGKIIGFVPLV